MDETETRRDVIAEDHDMRIQECPSLGAGCIIELEAIRAIVELDVKDEGLVAILQQRDGPGIFLGSDRG